MSPHSLLICTKVSTIYFEVVCEQALLFGRARRVSRERASERRRSLSLTPRSRVLARLASLAQTGELARRLISRPWVVNFTVDLSQEAVFIDRVHRIDPTKTYNFNGPTLVSSAADKITAKCGILCPKTLLFLPEKQLHAIHFFAAPCNIPLWLSHNPVRMHN